MNVLEEIVAHKRKEVQSSKSRTSYVSLEESAYFHREVYSFRDFLLNPGRTGIIAEFKRRSPSKGIINDKAAVEQVTHAYASAGASALSVLTDHHYFLGDRSDLLRARKVNDIPLLRKDFIVDEYQVVESKAWGADLILLIAAVLSPGEIARMAALARSLGLSVLLEVHSLEELERSLDPNVDAVGVNNRNLADFTVSVETSFKLAGHIPGEFLKVSESGISSPGTIRELKDAGFNGFLVGENFMRQPDPGAAMQTFVSELQGQ